MIHQAKLVVGVGIPRPVDFDGPGRFAGGGVTQVRRDAAILPLNSSMALKGELPLKKDMVAFNPPPEAAATGNRPQPPHSRYERGFFVELAGCSHARLLRKCARHCGRCRHCRAAAVWSVWSNHDGALLEYFRGRNAPLSAPSELEPTLCAPGKLSVSVVFLVSHRFDKERDADLSPVSSRGHLGATSVDVSPRTASSVSATASSTNIGICNPMGLPFVFVRVKTVYLDEKFHAFPTTSSGRVKVSKFSCRGNKSPPITIQIAHRN